ncbi:MAG: hypothetical protein COA44_08850 [Arcobacter sp.]|nr:MAG: hypothetical protein COA44_08850 [Arcobacter sp.]
MVYKITLSFFLILGFYACTPKPHVKFVENSISRDISIDGVRERMIGTLKEIEVYGENKSGDYMKFKYRVIWKDKDGFEIPSLSSKWTDFSVYKNTPYQFSVISPSDNAKEYMIYINESNH